MNTYFVFTCASFAVFVVAMMIGYQTISKEDPSLEDAIKTVENEKADLRLRADAVGLLTKKKAIQYVPRLGYILQGRYDTLAHHIVDAFRIFEDPGALPYLHEYELRSKNDGVNIPGKINAAVIQAKETCSRPKKK